MIDQYNEVRECDYKGEHYSVRDNGAVMRHAREGKRVRRKYDNVWTFGIKNLKDNYMYIGQHRVHIIVATAFFGPMDSKIYAVHHIDSNKCNNRIENLQWLTKLDNILLDPIALKKVTYLCDGDINKFINDHTYLQKVSGKSQKKEHWMRPVTKEEGRTVHDNMMYWASLPIKQDKEGQKDNNPDWMYEEHPNRRFYQTTSQFVKAKSPDNALQMNWKTPTEFLCCPEKTKDNPIKEYAERLSINKMFTSNRYCSHIVKDFAIVENGKALLVMTQDTNTDPLKPFGLTRIRFSGIQYIHENIQSFFEENGAKKRFTIMQGKEWTEADSMDDYC